MSYQVIVPKGSAPPLAPYSPGVKAGNALYVSGTLALDSSGKLVGRNDIRAQTRHILVRLFRRAAKRVQDKLYELLRAGMVDVARL